MWKPLKNRQGPLHDIGIKQRKNTNYEQLNLISKLIINRIQASLQWFFLGQKLTNYYIRHSFERHFFEIFPLTASQLCPQCWSIKSERTALCWVKSDLELYDECIHYPVLGHIYIECFQQAGHFKMVWEGKWIWRCTIRFVKVNYVVSFLGLIREVTRVPVGINYFKQDIFSLKAILYMSVVR